METGTTHWHRAGGVGLAVCAAALAWSGGGAPLLDPWRPVPAAAVQLTPAAALGDCAVNPIGPNGYDPNKQVFFGELHLHTGLSLDAFSFGTRTTPDEAYLYAKNQGDVAIDAGRLPGEPNPPHPFVARIPALDFVAITDHSEFLSVVQGCTRPTSGLFNEPVCVDVRNRRPTAQQQIFPQMAEILQELCGTGVDRPECVAQQQSAWAGVQAAAALANDPCRFTAFVGYEWSNQLALQNGDATNHRNVIFKDASVPSLPLNSVDYDTPPALWTGLDDQCTGPCEAVTIPHNSNLSAGLSLRVWDPSRRGLRQQKQYQVAAEIYQHKGASECRYDPATGFNEPECAFEQLSGAFGGVAVTERSFVRHALGQGLEASLLAPSANALKLGFVGGTDGHNGAPGNVEEHVWRGHDAGLDATALERVTDHPDWGPGGLTAVWAEENSREAIFAAIQRRETYATSGPRLRVRVLQTNQAGACLSPGYPGSVLGAATPMGGTITPTTLNGASPTFLVEAWHDTRPQALTRLPVGQLGAARIPKVQIIKIHTQLSGGVPVTVTDPPVDVIATANPASSFDPASGGCLSWTDPAFNATEPALYYVRVLQEPTWRWTFRDCLDLVNTPQGAAWGLTPALCAAYPINRIEERAWTSPIWYEPPGLLPANPPTGLSATVNGSAVHLSWAAPAGAAAIGYVLEAGTGPDRTDIATVPLGNATSFSVAGVPPGAYFVRVRASNAYGTGEPSNEVVFSVGGAAIPPGPPTGLAATVAGHTVTLTWSPPGSGGPPTQYMLQAGSAPASSDLVPGVPLGATATLFVAPGVPSGQYFVRVVAANASGASAPSNEVVVWVP